MGRALRRLATGINPAQSDRSHEMTAARELILMRVGDRPDPSFHGRPLFL